MTLKRAEPLLVILGIIGYTIWYLQETLRVSFDTENIVLVAPLAGVILVLSLPIVIKEIKTCRESKPDDMPKDDAAELAKQLNDTKVSLQMIGLTAIYIFSMDLIGFDVASYLYMLVTLLFRRERKIWKLVVYPLAYTVFVMIFFNYMLPYPIPQVFTFLKLI